VYNLSILLLQKVQKRIEIVIEKIISGGQTGVDRAALDIAIALNIAHGGWCPKGRLAEQGSIIPKKYLLKETYSSDYAERTKLNIKDSDGTLILIFKRPLQDKSGTRLTIEESRKKHKPHLLIELSNSKDIEVIISWLKNNNIKTLNIAGPRESQNPGIYQLSFTLLEKLLMSLFDKKEDGKRTNI
jgi:hypothetical protein